MISREQYALNSLSDAIVSVAEGRVAMNITSDMATINRDVEFQIDQLTEEIARHAGRRLDGEEQ